MKTGMICASLALSALVLVCGCSQKPYDKNFYAFEQQRLGQVETGPAAGILEVRGFSIDAPYGAKSLIYRTGDFKYQADFYSEFIIPPAAMITQKTQDQLAQSGMFERVVSAGSGTAAEYRLDGNILELYGDMRNKAAEKAVVKIAFFLVTRQPPQKVLLGKTYEKQCTLESKDANGLIAAYDKCLNEILLALQNDLKAAVVQGGEQTHP